MIKKVYVLLVSMFLILAIGACSENGRGSGVSASGSDIAGGENNNGNPSSGDGMPDGDIDVVEGEAPDDQSPDNNVSKDFSNPLNMVGRYKITGIKVTDENGKEFINETSDSGNFRGAFGVAPQVTAEISIDMGIKFQFNPKILKDSQIPEELQYINKKINKSIDMSQGLDMVKIFADLGATIDGSTIYFALITPDMPVAAGHTVTLTLDKVSDNAGFEIVNDPRKYWLEEGEAQPEVPVNPENPDNPTVEDPEQEIPVEGLINIDMNDLQTLTGHYKITRFITVAAGVTVDSTQIAKMQGEVAIKGGAAAADVISKMQMDANVVGMTDNDKYNYTVYEQFKLENNQLVSRTADPFKYSQAVISKKSDNQIEIRQSLKKNAPVVGLTDVDVTVVATKISNEPGMVNDCGYWDTAIVKACNEDGSAAMTNIDANVPETLIGSYVVTNYGMEYQRPAGGQYEKVWYKVSVLDGMIYEGKLLIDRFTGNLSIKHKGDSQAADFKVQLESAYQVQDAFLLGDFNDHRWRFFKETGTSDYTVTPTGNKNELKIKLTRTFTYKYWWTEYPVTVHIFFIVQKQADEPSVYNNEKYWATSENIPVVTTPDINNPRTITGHYKMTNMGHEYQRPGGAYEKNWASNNSSISKMQGEMWIKANDENGNLISGDLKTATVNAKYQLESWLYDGYDKLGILVKFDDKFKFHHSEFNDSYLIEMDPAVPSNIKVCRKEAFQYKYRQTIFNSVKTTTIDPVYICYIGEKISDNPQTISNAKYW